LEVIVDQINADLFAFANYTAAGKNGFLSRLVGIVAAVAAELWELGEAINSSQDPDKAVSKQLEALSLLTGTFRIEALASSVTLTLTGTPGTVVGATSRASTDEAEVFITTANITLTVVPNWVASTTYASGDRITNATRVYRCIAAGTTAGLGGPTTTSQDITDGTCHWQYLGEGTGVGDGPATALTTGPTVALAGDVKNIDTAVGGWQTVTNLLDAKVGFDTQTDESLRVSREEQLSQSGSGTSSAIRAELLRLTGVTSVKVFHNSSDVTDSDGMPPHSVEAMVRGGDPQLIVEALALQVPDGIATFGTESGTVVDSEGNTITYFFSRPAERNIGVVINVTKDPLTYPADGDAQVELAIAAFGNKQPSGKDAVASAISAQAFKVPGVLDVTSCLISVAAAPAVPPAPVASTTIAITSRQITTFDTTWITVNSVNGTP
jgi:uncharacterized phage protein gp47/JayE